MPTKRELLQKIDRNLALAEAQITDPGQCQETIYLLYDAYEKWNEIDIYAYKENDAARELCDLYENLEEYQQRYSNEDEAWHNTLEEMIEKIRRRFREQYGLNDAQSDDELSDNNEESTIESDVDELMDEEENILSDTDDLITPEIEETIDARLRFLAKPVTEKKKTGERAFVESLNYLVLDLQNFQSEMEYLVWYTAITLNLYMHNSTHRPMPGYGKSQQREVDGLLLYYRSQASHPHRKLHDRLTKKEDESRSTSLLPRNPAHVKLIENSAGTDSINKEFKKLDQRGFPQQGEKIERYFSLLMAYSGTRANNLNVYIQALNYLQSDVISDKLKKMLPKKRVNDSIGNQIEVVKDIRGIQENFDCLHAQIELYAYLHDLQNKMLKQRNDRANKIERDCKDKNFQHLFVQSTTVGTCIYIGIYPEFKGVMRSANIYAEGFTNVIIGFFGGLLNHYCQKNNLYIHTDRRQSFGFLRPTLTDLGAMQVRLSLGLEPSLFDDIILQCLNDLDMLLEVYNFKNSDDAKVKKYFAACEKPKGKKITEKTGNHLLASMRSDENKWRAFNEAHHYLNEQAEIDGNNYVKKAFEKYLDEFIYNKKPVSDAVQNELLIKTNLVIKEPNESHNFESTTLFAILNNLVIYAINFAVKLGKIKDDDVLLNLKHSYLHTLTKLHNNCVKALDLLSNIEVYEPTHLYAKACLLVENILEYLIALEALNAMQKNNKGEQVDSINVLAKHEKDSVILEFGDIAKDAEIYFTDSGQQAITTSLLTMNQQLTGSPNHSAKPVFVFEHSYYEIDLFLDKVAALRAFDKKTATIFFTDILCIKNIKLAELPNAKVMVIDITNCPVLDNPQLKQLIYDLHSKNIWVILVSSAIKHEELGLDKFQAGKMIFLPPKDESLRSDVRDELISISEHAMHPLLASFLEMIKSIFQEKVTMPVSKVSDNLSAKQLPRISLLQSKNTEQPQVAQTTSNTVSMQL